MRVFWCILLIVFFCVSTAQSQLATNQTIVVEYGNRAWWVNHAITISYTLDSHEFLLIYDRSREMLVNSWTWSSPREQFDVSLTYFQPRWTWTIGTRWKPPNPDIRAYTIFSWGW